MSNQSVLAKNIKEAIEVKQKVMSDSAMMEAIAKLAETMSDAYNKGNKVLFCGNGGSAADAQHLAAELSGRYYYDRPPLNSEALHVNTSYLTAVGNDYSFEMIYARMLEAIAHKGDILIAMSTSGNSPNVVKAVEQAKEMGMYTVGMAGASGGKMNDLCDVMIKVPSTDTPRIQEVHMLIGHTLCELVEKAIFPKP